jgi:hypothetical protein
MSVFVFKLYQNFLAQYIDSELENSIFTLFQVSLFISSQYTVVTILAAS